jgi:beta-dihydromenaquinone-9 omega-hydroxylase
MKTGGPTAAVAGFDPFDPEIQADPYPSYRWLRREAPCYYVEPRDMWVLSRYDDVRSALRDHDRFSSAEGIGYRRRPTFDMITSDPPVHTRLRRTLNRHFLPRAMMALRPRIEVLAAELLDELIERRDGDWVAMMAEPLPIIVIAELLGIRPEDRLLFKRWSDAIIARTGGDLPPDAEAEAECARAELVDFLRTELGDRARHRCGTEEQLLSVLTDAATAGALTEMEAVTFCMLLLVAGNETTTNAIGNGALAVTENGVWPMLRTDPSLAGATVEEILRFDAPIQGLFRTTLSAVEVAGTTIPPGSRVQLLYGSANRDETQFPDPDRFDLRRGSGEHLAFGSGIHHCLGAPLARLELEVLVTETARRLRRFELVGEPVRTSSPLVRGLLSLPIRVVPA